MKAAIVLFTIILVNLFIASTSFSQELTKWQTVYFLQLKIFENDKVVLSNISSANSTISNFPIEKTDYTIKVLSYGNKELFEANLGVSFEVSIDPIGVVKTNETMVNPRVPFYPTSKYITIYHQDKKIFEIDLSKSFCNKNSVCDVGEDQYNCPEDCKIKKGVSIWFYVFILIAVISVVTFLILFKFKPKSQSYSDLYKKWK